MKHALSWRSVKVVGMFRTLSRVPLTEKFGLFSFSFFSSEAKQRQNTEAGVKLRLKAGDS